MPGSYQTRNESNRLLGASLSFARGVQVRHDVRSDDGML